MNYMRTMVVSSTYETTIYVRMVVERYQRQGLSGVPGEPVLLSRECNKVDGNAVAIYNMANGRADERLGYVQVRWSSKSLTLHVSLNPITVG